MKNESSKKKSCFYENEVKCFGNTLWKQASKISSISNGQEDHKILEEVESSEIWRDSAMESLGWVFMFFLLL